MKKTMKPGTRVLLTFAVMLFLTCLLNGLFGSPKSWFYTYDGLDEQKPLETNTYVKDAFYTVVGRIYYEDEGYTSLCGVDVSSYQGEIRWEELAADNVDFAIIRLGYRGYLDGQLVLDPAYEKNIEGARKSGMLAGVYFFSQATTVEEAIEEAEFVLENIRWKGVKGPVAFDMEYVQGATRINSLTVEEKTEIADAFCDTIESHGYDAMIYGNTHWLTEDIDQTWLTDHGVWLAHYTYDTKYPFAFDMWQYMDWGRVAGIDGNADLNVWIIEK